MKAVRYPPEFKAKALKQVTERGHGGGERSQATGDIRNTKAWAVEKTQPCGLKFPGSKQSSNGPTRRVTS